MKCKKNDSGFSLIEMIVVIAILAIALGLSVSITGLIRSSKLSSMPEKLCSAIGELRVNTLSKADKYRLVIKKDSGDYIAVIQKEVTTGGTTSWQKYEKTKISDYGSVYFYGTDNVKRQVGTGSSGYTIVISYDRGDKTFSEIVAYPTSDFNAGNLTPANQVAIKSNEIVMEYSSKTKTVKLLKETGKYYIK